MRSVSSKRPFRLIAGVTTVRIAEVLSGKLMLTALLVSAFAGSGMLVWQLGIAPILNAEPSTVSDLVPPVELDTQSLQSVIARRAERLRHAVRPFTQFNQIFTGSTPVPAITPTPSTPPPVL